MLQLQGPFYEYVKAPVHSCSSAIRPYTPWPKRGHLLGGATRITLEELLCHPGQVIANRHRGDWK